MIITAKVDGQFVRKGLQDLEADVPQIGRQQFRTTSERIVRRMSAYPPDPPHRIKYGQHAVLGKIIVKQMRTGKLGRSWKIDNAADRYTIENTAENKRGQAYGQYVHGNAYGQGQMPFDKAYGWETFRDVVDEEFAKLPDEIKPLVIMVARRDGFEVKT